MATVKLDDRTLLVTETPMVPFFPDRPAPARTEPIRLTLDEVLAQVFGGDQGAFDLALMYQFPKSIGRNTRTGSPIWDAGQIDAWRTRMRDVIKVLSKTALAK